MASGAAGAAGDAGCAAVPVVAAAAVALPAIVVPAAGVPAPAAGAGAAADRPALPSTALSLLANAAALSFAEAAAVAPPRRPPEAAAGIGSVAVDGLADMPAGLLGSSGGYQQFAGHAVRPQDAGISAAATAEPAENARHFLPPYPCVPPARHETARRMLRIP